MPIPLAMPDLVPSPHSLLPERARLDECMHHFLSRHFAVCPFGHLPTLWNRLLSPMRPGSATRDDWQLAGLLLAICAFSAQSLALGSISSHYSIMESRTMADKAVQALTTGRCVLTLRSSSGPRANVVRTDTWNSPHSTPSQLWPCCTSTTAVTSRVLPVRRM